MALTETQITALAHRFIDAKIEDGVLNSRPFIGMLNEPKNLMLVDGGRTISGPVTHSATSGGGSYSGSEALDISEEDPITGYSFAWKQYYEPVRISNLDLAIVSGKAAQVNFLLEKVDIAMANMEDKLSTGIFSDGTTNSSKVITGLQATYNTTSSTSYGGIAEDDMATWVASRIANSGTNIALSLQRYQRAQQKATEGKRTPSAALMDKDVFNELYNLLLPHQRVMTDDNLGRLGHKGVLLFNGIPNIIDSHMSANRIYFPNLDFLKLAVHPKHNMRKVEFKSLETSDSLLIRMHWYGNLICKNRRFQGELGDIQVAS